MIKIN